MQITDILQMRLGVIPVLLYGNQFNFVVLEVTTRTALPNAESMTFLMLHGLLYYMPSSIGQTV
jgi:hypothetical protein